MQHHICTLLNLHLRVSDQGGAHVVTDDEQKSFPSLCTPHSSPPLLLLPYCAGVLTGYGGAEALLTATCTYLFTSL